MLPNLNKLEITVGIRPAPRRPYIQFRYFFLYIRCPSAVPYLTTSMTMGLEGSRILMEVIFVPPYLKSSKFDKCKSLTNIKRFSLVTNGEQQEYYLVR